MKFNFSSRRALGMLVLGASIAQLNTAGAVPMDVTAQVQNYCDLGVTTDVAFGLVSGGSATPFDADGSVEWRCTVSTNGTVSINDGLLATREMDSGTDTLAYELYSDALRTSVWNAATPEVVVGTGLGAFTAKPVHGRVTAAAVDGATVGNYTDTVDITIAFTP